MIHHRHSIRLPGFDYSQEGSYFVTIVTKDREPLFGEIIDDEMRLNEIGKIVEFTWNDLIHHNPDIGLDEFVIMPNHIHGIIHIFNPIGAGLEPAPKRTPLSEIVRQFKTFSAKRINQNRGTPGLPVWQRNYYEHIIGTDHEYQNNADYIENNPLNWSKDNEITP